MSKLNALKMNETGRSGFLENYDKDIEVGPGSYDPNYKCLTP